MAKVPTSELLSEIIKHLTIVTCWHGKLRSQTSTLLNDMNLAVFLALINEKPAAVNLPQQWQIFNTAWMCC